MGNTFGQLFRVTTFGESHGGGIGVVIDGCPPKIDISEADIQRELDRRRPGQSKITTQRKEEDRCEILSGVFEGKTLGTPIAILVRNKDARPEAYAEMKKTFRPSHADFTYEAKYGIRNWQGGGRASARETIGRVAAGAIARKVLRAFYPKIDIVAYVTQIHELAGKIDKSKVKTKDVDAKHCSLSGCGNGEEKMISLIEKTRAQGDSLGGVIECIVRNAPPGLGEPVFDKLEADLAKAMLSLPATKGFEIGSGFSATRMRGSEHNDAFEMRDNRVRTATNYSGGIQGGISNGEEIYFRVAFKPTATIAREQKTVTDVAGTDEACRAWPARSMCSASRRADGGSNGRSRPLRSRAAATSNFSDMNPPLQQTVGSPLWQLVFLSFAVVLVLFEIVRGWRLGLMRQVMRVIAIVAAYAAAYFGGQLLVPIARPLVKIPDIVLSILCGALLALIVYLVIISIGTIVFKRTRQQGSAFVRFFYGLTGAVIGLFMGAFLVWLVVIGVRSIGAVADAQVREQASNNVTPERSLHAVDVRRGLFSGSDDASPSLMSTLARLKNSLEMGAMGDIVKKTDAIPTRTYETLGKLGQVASNPQSAERFFVVSGCARVS